MPNIDLKQSIASALAHFANGSLADNARALFNVLGYRSDKTVRLAPTPQTFISTFDAEKKFNSANALFDQWTSAELVFQLTTDEVARPGQRSLFESHNSIDRNVAQSYLFLAIALRDGSYTRSQLASITRAVNKIFMQPALILFKHGATLTLAVIDRRINKRDELKDVLEKVTLIKDIRVANPHRAHIEILFDLALDELRGNFDIANWVQLHDAWRATLDTSELNKKFFREIANWYFWAQSKCKFPKGAGRNDAERNATSVIRLLTRLIFVWFVKEKNLVPDDLFDKRRVDELLKFDDPKDSTYYKAILQNLFFGTLNTEMGAREFRHQAKASGRADDYMTHNRYRYQKYFKDADAFLKLCAPVPFLNGGLFECLDKSQDERVDGFSDRPDNELVVPDELFFGKERDLDLNDIFGTKNKRYTVRGLIHTFDHYKFTVDENTPIEEEIALDPELLGKVFENLLAAYNPETGVTARKQTGSFYTPREIVNYMVDESLKAYLQTQTGLNDLSGLLAYNEEPHGLSDVQASQLVNAIDRLKALDPAAGSGAFPMGLLHKLVYVLGKLDPTSAHWKAIQTAHANAIADVKERAEELDDIADAFANGANYARKLYLIENCLYGVDIQPIAVQICKLRCFISLIVDDKVDDAKPNRGVRPLPNLETKFVAANSLIGIERPQNAVQAQAQIKLTAKQEKLRDELVDILRMYLKMKNPATQKTWLAKGEAATEELNRAFQDVPGFTPIFANWIFTTARSVDDLIDKLPGAKQEQASEMMFRDTDVKDKEKQLAEVRQRHFRARTRKTKEDCRKQDEKLRAEIAGLLKQSGWGDDTAQKLATWNPYDQNIAAGFFDPEWMFDVRDGFDIVIGNPPYSSKQSVETKQYTAFFQYVEYKCDPYAFFIELGYKSLKKFGVLAYINPVTWMTNYYYAKLRTLLIKSLSLQQIVLIDGLVFENANVDTCLLFVHKEAMVSRAFSWIRTSPDLDDLTSVNRDYATIEQEERMDITPAFDLGWDKVRAKLDSAGERLDAISKISLGMKLQQNDLFVSDKQDRQHPDPIFFGKDIAWYGYLQPARFFNFKTATIIGGTKKPEVHHAKPKILTQAIRNLSLERRLVATLDTEGSCFVGTVNAIVLKNTEYDIRYVLGLVNSNLLNTYFRNRFTTISLTAAFLGVLPIRNIKTADEKQVAQLIKLVDRILSAKRKDADADTSALEQEIDALVYQLYGLTKEEIKVVEG